MPSAVPQLQMYFTRFEALTPPEPVPGYGLRTFRSGDEEAWLALLNMGDFDLWDRDRLDRMLAGERAPLPPEGIFFATRNDQPVGAACLFLHPSPGDEDVPELGWVVVHPEHRGHGLGTQLCRAALNFAGSLGHRYFFLGTEDYRPAAIRLYLRLGFEPMMMDPAHPAWWRAFRETAGVP